MYHAQAQPTRSSGAATAKLAVVLRLLTAAGALLWWMCTRAYSSRTTYLLHYASQELVSPRWEVFVPVSVATLAVTLCGLAFWLGASEVLWRRLRYGDSGSHTDWVRQWACGIGFLIAACVPWLIDLAIHWNHEEPLLRADGIWGPTVWQPLWLAAFSGLAADRLVRALQLTQRSAQAAVRPNAHAHDRWLAAGVGLAAILCGVWWFLQSERAFDSLLLGFNDCGHFAQRIANTAAGRGWLIESPVLPRFWDHFNPGLTLFVPFWLVWPDMSLIFIVQAGSLAVGAPLIMYLARALGAGPLAACLWAIAWLLQPSLGQMNLAYFYGWHPISTAIPLLLVAMLCLFKQRWLGAAVAAVLASSMEEGVLVIIATTAATLGALELGFWLVQRSRSQRHASAPLHATVLRWGAVRRVSSLLSARRWLAIAGLATVAFILVFRLSGLAEFQTGRFHVLGDSPLEIALSPVQRPDVFWGLLFRNRNAIFLAGILLPCYVPALVRAWPLLLPTALPLGVLLVWDHFPAQSLAFHYPSILLPIFWLAAIAGASVGPSADEASNPSTRNVPDKPRRIAGTSLSFSAAALMTSLVASIPLGQLPWSGKTLGDATEATYDRASQWQRKPGDPDNQFARKQLATLAKQGESVLATGRLATHLVGCSELETVGQFPQRMQALADLTPGEHPLRRYRWLILDRKEGFQQRPYQTELLQQEAIANGFRIVEERFEIVVLSRD